MCSRVIVDGRIYRHGEAVGKTVESLIRSHSMQGTGTLRHRQMVASQMQMWVSYMAIRT
jgi:hypothetical protein